MICTLTINPAIDKLLFISELNRDNTNRIQESKNVLGGKGTHVSINLSLLGEENRAYGIGYGKTGTIIEEMLKNSKIQVEFLHFDDGESRTNYALVEENHFCTLITEKGRIIPKNVCRQLLDRILDTIGDEDYLVLSGDASNTEIPFVYNYVMQEVKQKKPGVKIFLDTSSENLIKGLDQKPFLVKPNEDELSQIMGKPISGDEEVLEGIKWIKKKGIECVAVSRGGKGSIVAYKEDIYKINPLQVNVINTIGCGDAYLSGLVYGFKQNMDFPDILKLAASVSAATAESDLTVGFDVARVMELREMVNLQKLR